MTTADDSVSTTNSTADAKPNGSNSVPEGNSLEHDYEEPQSTQSSPENSKSTVKPRTRSTRKKAPAKTARGKSSTRKRVSRAQSASVAKFPRHSVDRALRIPQAIIDQNAGHPSTRAEAAKFLGVSTSGAFDLEISSAKKYGFLEGNKERLTVTERAKRAVRPQSDSDEIAALREATLAAPDISEVYNHYRGEYIPDDNFFANALTERFRIPVDKISDFRTVFFDSLRRANLLDESGGRSKLIDIGREDPVGIATVNAPARSTDVTGSEKTIKPVDGSCFVVQPFAEPYGGYYETLFRPAIEKAGLRPLRADAEIFGTGKIIDQIWRGIRSASVLLAELTTKNANVYYELGLAHALGKPVVLVAANESDVPFDLRHIRVVYYDREDPFWGAKLVDKIAENVRSAIENPEEAIFRADEV